MRLQLLFATVILLFSHLNSYSQIVLGIGYTPKNPPYEIIGEMDGETLYCHTFDFKRSNTLELFNIEGNSLNLKNRIQLPNDYIHQIFIYKEHYFLLVSDFDKKNYSIIKLDESNEEVSRIHILPYRERTKHITSSKVLGRFEYTFQSKNLIALSVKEYRNRFAIVNLETFEFSTHVSDLKKDLDYTMQDCLFGEDLNAIFALGTVNNSNEAFVICSGQNHRNVVFPLMTKNGDYHRSFKFASDNGINYITSFYINKSKKEQGYTLTPIPDFDFTSLELISFPDNTLNNPQIWTEQQFKKVQKGKYPIKNYSYRIISADFVDGSLLIKAQSGDQYKNTNFMLSRIEITGNKPKVAWTYLSHFISDHYLTYNTKWGNRNFITYIQEDNLYLFNNILTDHLTTSGEPDLKSKEKPEDQRIIPKTQSQILKTKIDLKTGKFVSKIVPLVNPDEPTGKITSPCYHIRDDQFVMLLYQITYPNFQFSEPSVLSIPLESLGDF